MYVGNRTELFMNSTPEAVLQNGKYILGNKLGKGVFGITYRATNSKSGETVVIKTFSDNLRQNVNFEQFKQRLHLGLPILANCQHPNLVRLLEYFEEDGIPYLVMEDIRGQTLTELLETNQQISVPQAIYYIRQICAAVNVLHSRGLLHRDIRPQNIIRRAGTHKVVLTDFGIACELTTGVMQTHASLLSSGFAPIEKYLAHIKRTPATDVYAIAATLYCLLTRQPPVAASVRDRIPLTDIKQFQPHLNPAIEQAILRGLELLPEKRPQTLEAWLALLPKETPARRKRSKQNLAAKSSQVNSQKQVLSSLTSVEAVDTVIQPEPVDLQPQRLGHDGDQAVNSQVENKLDAQNTHSRQHQEQDKAKQRTQTNQSLKSSDNNWRVRSLILTAAIAAALGTGFGLSLRLNRPSEPGSTFLHTEQSFPPRSNWPILNTPQPTPQVPITH
ncbi:serine/threonine protein kinase [Crinalium epipsammum PCC 9333]|uniref:non-specific serine/threonine protein kinase n=2 Tax=Crinalium TaxID=241421 RepID=K9VX93_9CYAN|nr:serine/threonine protein kinase [Crinalium epipsammum PCC 9333]